MKLPTDIAEILGVRVNVSDRFLALDPHEEIEGQTEQKCASTGGERGGEAADQGEHIGATHVLDAERGY